MRNSGVVLAGAAALICSGCHNAATAVVARPSDITLDSALASTVQAIYGARKVSRDLRTNEPGHIPLGLNVCTTTAVFNVVAGATHTGTVNGTIGTPSNLYISASISGGVTDTQTASRGNQITVVFVSPACNPTGTLGTTSPEKVTLLEQEIEAARDPNLPQLRSYIPLGEPPSNTRGSDRAKRNGKLMGNASITPAADARTSEGKTKPAPTPPTRTVPFTPDPHHGPDIKMRDTNVSVPDHGTSSTPSDRQPATPTPSK